MTHPTLGYTNFRFADNDAVHMPAFNGAGHVIACNAEGPTEHDLWPYGVDAPVDCPNCLHARESDWWMAQTEELRRNGAQADWPEPTMDDVKAVIARGLSQVDARMEVAILGTGENPTEFTGILSDNTQRLVQISTSRDYDASAMQSLTERMKPVVQSQFMGEVIDRNDRDAQLARYLARSPLSYLASEAGKTGRRLGLSLEEQADGVADEPFPVDMDPEDFVAVPQSETNEPVNVIVHPDGTQSEIFDDGPAHDIGEVEFTPGGEVVTSGGENDYPDVNWCHVHNRQAQPGREECSECDGERGEDQKAGES